MNRKLFLWAIAISVFTGLLLLNIFPPAHPQEIEFKEPYLCEYNEREGAYEFYLEELKKHYRKYADILLQASSRGDTHDDALEKVLENNILIDICHESMKIHFALVPHVHLQLLRKLIVWMKAFNKVNEIADLRTMLNRLEE